ncbi:MAG: universal stress protein [Chloroflexi bacterium]|nr:universal stress protein [Chloroflexota bacterium]
MFSRVLFPTDLSAYADSVLACLPSLKSAGLHEVVLLSVIRRTDVPLHNTINLESLKYWRWYLSEQLNVAKMALEGNGLRTSIRIEYGNPVEQIVRVAEDERVEMIVIGAQGITAAQELYVGSTAYGVIRYATMPVYLQKFKVIRELGHVKCYQVCEHAFRRVLHPTDFSDCANAAFQVVKHLKAAGCEEVIVVHVQDDRIMKHRPSEQLAEFDQKDTERLETLCRALRMFGLSAQPFLRHGVPFKETLNLANEMEVSLIVMGSHGRSAIQETLAGSTFENVARLCQQPVLVLRPQRN